MNASKVQLIAMGVAILFIVPPTARAEEPVYFADANLKAVVEQALDITDPTPTDMLALTWFKANYSGIADLSGIEYATNLCNLYLSDNQISDVTPLSGLTNLTVLDLSVNYLSDITPLSRLTNLTWLNLGMNGVSDISALSGMSLLSRLELYCNSISDLSPLSGLTNLTSIELSLNYLISDISALSGLTNVRWLGLGPNQISDISSLSSLTNLEGVCLVGNQISDISALSGLTNLRTVLLESNPLNRDAYCVYVPMIRDNNPGVYITYDLNPYVCSLSVEIDIKPGSYPNSINLGSFGLVPVAILSSDVFNATTVDPDTVQLAGAGVAVRGKGNKSMAHEEDVNGDEIIDLVVQVETQNLQPEQFQDGYAVLTGTTFDGQDIEGQDEITIVPPEE